MHSLTSYSHLQTEKVSASSSLPSIRLCNDRLSQGDTCFWSLGQQCRRSYRCRYQPLSIQTAAYVILACVERDRIAETVCIVSWLSEQMDGCGGYRSTQVTACKRIYWYIIDRNVHEMVCTVGYGIGIVCAFSSCTKKIL